MSRYLMPSDPFCPACGHNRDTSSVSSIDNRGGTKSCQICGVMWFEAPTPPKSHRDAVIEECPCCEEQVELVMRLSREIDELQRANDRHAVFHKDLAIQRDYYKNEVERLRIRLVRDTNPDTAAAVKRQEHDAQAYIEASDALIERIQELTSELLLKDQEIANLKSKPAPDPKDDALRMAREALILVKRDSKHWIPSYAFSGNEAACTMDRLLENIEGYGDEALAAIDKVLGKEVG